MGKVCDLDTRNKMEKVTVLRLVNCKYSCTFKCMYVLYMGFIYRILRGSCERINTNYLVAWKH